MADVAGAIIKGLATWERKAADFYPTPYDVTESLIPVIKSIAERPRVRAGNGPFRIWEPACGDLDMSRVLEWHGFEVTSTDLRDTGQGIGGIDFLNDDPLAAWGWEVDVDMIVTNPPFNLARQFIEKSLSYTPNVAMLLKIDYWSAVSRLELWNVRRPTLWLPLTFRPAFLKKERGNSPLMNVAWCVWTEPCAEECVVEPIKKIVYPGYDGNGLRKSLALRGQALDDLAEAVRQNNDARR